MIEDQGLAPLETLPNHLCVNDTRQVSSYRGIVSSVFQFSKHYLLFHLIRSITQNLRIFSDFPFVANIYGSLILLFESVNA